MSATPNCWDCGAAMEPHPRWDHRLHCPDCGLSAPVEHCHRMHAIGEWAREVPS